MSTLPDLRYSDVEDALRASVRDLLADRCPWSAVLRRCETSEPYDMDLWRRLAGGLGCAGLLVPERYGGAGASAREVAVVLEELGRAVAPVPFLGSAVLATSALLACGAGDGADDCLGPLAAGERTAALAVPFATPPGAPFPASVHAEGDRLTGRVVGVVDAVVADLLVVPATGADGPGLYVVEVGGSAVAVTLRTSLDLTRPIADVTLDGAAARRVAGPESAAAALDAALVAGAALLASEQLGVAEQCLETTVGYVKTRYQFGRPIGGFQAVKHRLADLWAAVTSARSAARYAAACLATADPDVRVATAVAQAHCSEVAVTAAEECVQLHGGIGFTWEHPAHLYLKRAKACEIALGSPDRHRAALAALVDLPAATP
ncbi:Acyl-CoA dehydrogenase [Carbonactinospora thermoautotrophica]|uniref:Acyl-CoA dehydrogenase n=2 Tax=Carbonactinospora thermoautotrophica TaxID=1469144 RepID=A0A132MYZ9_9ACTN|nr:acyl-CoA dehydrogenase family protein [Carbonactinospora thermoautotrophica]KWX03037.1 Acyl-CoA dehydrogenase [Carbonactinospora thermoautotrophica]